MSIIYEDDILSNTNPNCISFSDSTLGNYWSLLGVCQQNLFIVLMLSNSLMSVLYCRHMGIFGQIVIGPPGSGKSTYCRAMHEFMTGLLLLCLFI